MAINLVTASPVAGGDSAYLTTPTYTFVADAPPVPNSVQWLVSALGGTQTNVRTHLAYSPFSVTFYKPVNPKLAGLPDPVTGVLRNVPVNEYSIVTRKGVIPVVGQPPALMTIVTKIRMPAGADYADVQNVQAAISAHIGTLKAQDGEIAAMPLYASF